MHARKQRRVDDVARVRIDDHLLVTLYGQRLSGSDEPRANISEVATHRLRGENRGTIADGARQRQRPFMYAPQFIHQRQRVQRTGMPACACAHGN